MKMRSRYIGKIDTVALLLLGGVKPENLKEWYNITNNEIAQAERKIERLKLKEVKTRERT